MSSRKNARNAEENSDGTKLELRNDVIVGRRLKPGDKELISFYDDLPVQSLNRSTEFMDKLAFASIGLTAAGLAYVDSLKEVYFVSFAVKSLLVCSLIIAFIGVIPRALHVIRSLSHIREAIFVLTNWKQRFIKATMFTIVLSLIGVFVLQSLQ